VIIGVLDYGSGNLHSVCRAIDSLDVKVKLSSSPDQLADCDGLVVPGVGAFSACLDGLIKVGGDQLIRRRLAAGQPVLGICVGHQAMFTSGLERGLTTAGLGLLAGRVERLTARRIPHIGWNNVSAPPDSVMFAGLNDQRFYFVHSYGVHSCDQTGISWCHHDDDRFVAAVEAGPLWTTQFHPEKSGAAGAKLLANWLGFLTIVG